MKVIFMSGGEREKALQFLLEKGIEVVAVVTPYITKSNDRFKKVVLTAVQYGIPVFSVRKDEDIYDTLKFYNIDCDLLLSCGFPYIIDKKLIDSIKFAVNVHPTLLPKYRGYRTGPYIIMNGEKKSGITVHFITEDMDKGDIIIQKSFEVTKFDTTKSLYRKSREFEPEVIYEALKLLEKGDFRPIPQNEEEQSTYTYIRTPKDSQIDWNKPLKDLYNEIRACDPDDYPAYFYVDGEKVCLKLWRENKLEDEEDMI